MKFDAKAALAALVLAASFLLLGIYVWRNQTPDGIIVAIVAAAISGVLAYYFGSHNGNITGLAASAVQVSSMAAQLASQAIEKRSSPSPTVTVVTPAAPPTGPSSA